MTGAKSILVDTQVGKVTLTIKKIMIIKTNTGGNK